jgi:hypothetical protein
MVTDGVTIDDEIRVLVTVFDRLPDNLTRPMDTEMLHPGHRQPPKAAVPVVCGREQ